MTRPGSRVRPRLRTRLIAWYTGTLCCVLLVAALGVHFVVARTLERAHEESIAASVALFQQFFRVEIAEYRTAEATLSHIAGELVFEDRVMELTRPDGTPFRPPTVLATRQEPQLRPPVRSQAVPLDPQLAPGWTINIRSSSATLAAASRRIDVWLLGGIPAVVVVSALLGWLLAGRALRPIGRMADQARTLNVRAGSRLDLMDPTDELGRFGASFNAVLDRLDDALSQQRRFLADAAHELRAPLARLRSRAELGRMAVAQAPGESVRQEAQETLHGFEREVIAASDAVGSLLALARADAGATVVSMSDGFLDDVLSDELPRWRETAAMAQVQVALGDFEEVRARFDGALMCRLLGLLLDNAIHYAPAGSTVTVHLRAASETACLIVEDEGCGIPASEREQVFQRFYRGTAARARRAEGSGLGLALARWIVEQHHGTIAAVDRRDGATGIALVARWPRWPRGSGRGRPPAGPTERLTERLTAAPGTPAPLATPPALAPGHPVDPAPRPPALAGS